MASSKTTETLQLKADFLPITVLKISKGDTNLLSEQLESIIKKAPNYFSNTPVLMDFSRLVEGKDPDNIAKMCAILREHQLQPIAARGIKQNLSIPVIPDRIARAPASEQVPEKKVAETIVIDKPVRAGTQIYAKDADLIVLTSVNAGAEIIADGHIHVYGPLRGRALAGASGNINARIFCKTLEAELVAIAGRYLVNEKINMPTSTDSMLQILLEDEQLLIKCV